jgi:hypothetical protein
MTTSPGIVIWVERSFFRKISNVHCIYRSATDHIEGEKFE